MTWDATVVALAARFAPAQVTPPAGYRNIQKSTGNLPNQLGKLPTVLVFLEGGEWTDFPSKRDGVHRLLVRFYYAQAGASDLARDMVALRKWLDVLSYQLQASYMLGGAVSLCWLEDWRVGILDYAGEQYTGIEFGVRIVTNEGWAAVA